MPHPQAANRKPSHIRAVFRTTAAFFDMPAVTTYEELADRLCSLGERHGGPLTRIDMEAVAARTGEDVHATLVSKLASF